MSLRQRKMTGIGIVFALLTLLAGVSCAFLIHGQILARDVFYRKDVDMFFAEFVPCSILMFVGVGAAFCFFLSGSRLAAKKEGESQCREYLFEMITRSPKHTFILFSPETYQVDYISPNLEQVVGVKPKLIQKDVRRMTRVLVSSQSMVSEDLLSSLPLGQYHEMECQILHKSSGERRWYKEALCHIALEERNRFVMILTDVTQEHEINDSLENALYTAGAANMAKSNFLSNMSHDIRTPMNAIVGYTTLLARDADQPQKVLEYTRKIGASSEHLLNLINNVLDMSKIESGKTTLNITEFHVPQLLERINTIILSQIKARNQSYEMRLTGDISEVLMGDEVRINQVLLNLLSNAVKYTPEGGRIEFHIQSLPAVSPDSARLQFTVQDNGYGMSEEFLKEVFSPFVRESNSNVSKIQGTGLGLSISKNIVELMGGTIEVQSRQGEGSRFVVQMEFGVSKKERDRDFWRHSSISRILIVDDEEDICQMIQSTMEGTGVSVEYVTAGPDAIDILQKSVDNKESFHVILLDWKMPEMDGLETARRIREKVGKDVPILMLTSHEWGEIEEEAREAGMDEFLTKPFFLSSFQNVMGRLLWKDGTEGEPAGEGQQYSLEGLNFLVAEDNELNAEILQELLEMEGAKCRLAVNGQEAVEMFEESQPGDFDMILMDVQMPLMDGYEATRQIRACTHPRAKEIPIVAMTANAFVEDVKNALDAGMNAHIAKPVDMKVLRETLGRYLKKT